MIKKSFVALAALLCGSIAFAAPGAFSQWFENAVTDPLTKGTPGWSTSAALDDGGAVAVTTDAAVTYTATAPATAYAKQTVTITSEPLDELPATNDDSLTDARFAFGVAQVGEDTAPAVYVLSKVDGTATWTKTSAPVGTAANGATAVEVTYDKPGRTFTVAGVDTVFTSLLDNSDDWTTTTFVGNGAVNGLVGAKAGVGVAMIEGVGYDTLAAAITAAGTTKTIDLTADVTLPTGAATYKINTNGFALNTPEGYFSTVDGVTVTVAKMTGTTTDASMIWDRDFTTGRVDANGNNWSFYTPTGVTKANDGITMTEGGGASLINRTKNPTGLSGTITVILRAKNIALPTTGQSALIRIKQGDLTIGASINSDGYYTRIWTDGGLDWNTRRDKSVVLAPTDVEQTYVLTYEYAANQTKGTYFYRVDGARTVTKLWNETGLQATGLDAVREISLLGKWNGNACVGSAVTGVAVFEGSRLSEEAIANFDWSSPAPNKAAYTASDDEQAYYGYIPSTAKLIWPGLTLNDIKDKLFSGVMNGNWVAADSGAGSGTIAGWANGETTVEKAVNADSIVLDFKRTNPEQDKYVRVTLTEGDGGIKAVAVAGTTKGGTNSALATDDNTGNYGIKVLRAFNPVAEVNGVGYATLADAIVAAGEPTAEEPVTVTLLKASADAVAIPANVTVEVNGQTFTGAVTGAGKIKFAGFATVQATTRTSLAAETWEGTLVITQPTSGQIGANDSTVGGLDENYRTKLNDFGNVRSKIEFLNCTYTSGNNNYFGKSYVGDGTGDVVIQPELIVTGEFKLNNGFSQSTKDPNNYTIIRKLSGTGKIVSTYATQLFYILDGADFDGEISTTHKKFVFGARESADGVPADGSVMIKAGQTVEIAVDKVWSADGGIQVNGVLNVEGSTSSAVKGTGTVVYTATSQTMTDAMLTGNAYANSAWQGTVWLKGIGATGNNTLLASNLLNKLGGMGSTVKMTGCNGYIATSDGTFNFALELENDENGVAWKNPSGASGSTRTFAALKGTGLYDGRSLEEAGKAQCKELHVFTDGSTFAGSINVGQVAAQGSNNRAGKRVVFGVADGEAAPTEFGEMLVRSDAAVTIPAGQSWTAAKIFVRGSVTANGTIAANEIQLSKVGAQIVSANELTVTKAASLTEYQVKTVESAGTYTYTLEALPPTPGVITVAQGDSAQQVVVTVPVSNADGQTVTLVVKDKDGTTLPGTHTGKVTGGQAKITIDGAADTGYTFEATVGETPLGEGAFFTGVDNVWFGAYAANDTTVNGSWNTKPTITDGQYVVNSAEGNTFTVAAAKQGEGDGKLAKIVQVVTFTSAIEVADLPAVEDGTVGGLTVAQGVAAGEDAPRYVWMGVVGDAWVTLEGATPALDTEYTVTVEYDRRGTDGVFTYKVGGVTLGANTITKKAGFNGVTAMGSGKLTSIEATAALPAAEGYLTSGDDPIRVDDAFAAALVPEGDHAAVQAALLGETPDGALKVWEAYALGASADAAKTGVKPVISGAQTSDTDKMKIVDGFTVREHTGIAVTRTVKTKAVVTDDWTTDGDAEQEADGVSVALPAEGAKAKYIKIEYTFR